MQVFIARQPILDLKQNLYGYELLFRDSFQNFFTSGNPDQASASTVASAAFTFDWDNLTDGHMVFVNATRSMLLGDSIGVLPPTHTVIEILETVKPDKQVLAACRRWKNEGFRMALDDFVYSRDHEPLMQLADVIKVDILNSDEKYHQMMAKTCVDRGITPLAEKVENFAEFQKTREMGYSLFQGYFFARPEILTHRDIPTTKLAQLELLRQLQNQDLDLDKLEQLLRRNVGLSYKLLRYINSAFFALPIEVRSVRHALTLLGEMEVRKWASLVVLAGLVENKPEAIIIQAIFRAKFLEGLAPLCSFEKRSQDLFLMGLFSLLDALLDQPMDQVLKTMPLSLDMKEALISQEGRLGALLSLCFAYEQGQWKQFSVLAKLLNLDEEYVPGVYNEAVTWAKSGFIDR